MPHIGILIHEHGSFGTQYYLRWLADIWSELGHQVTVIQGPTEAFEADVVVLHVDLTVVPENYLEFIRRFPVVINRSVEDISKRRITQNLVAQGDDYDGPVIVKADRNWGGRREAQLAAKGLGPDSDRRILREYLVLESQHRVPEVVWQDPLIIVDRFLPERRGDLYCLRMWKFFGDQEASVLGLSPEPIVKAANIVRREPLTDVPEELREIRKELGFDFGKFDYAIVDGGPVLYDVNRTPAIPPLPKEQNMIEFQRLAEGLRPFILGADQIS